MKVKTYQVLTLIIFFISFGVYLSTLSSSVYGGDSSELVAVGSTWGVAHPPGYPLFTVLANIFVRLPLSLTQVEKINCLSALFQSLSSVVIFLIILKLCQNLAAAFFSSLTYSFLYPVWLYGVVTELFALNNLIAAIIIMFSLLTAERLRNERGGVKRWLFLLSSTIGLSLSHHHTIVLIFPAVLYLLWEAYKKQKKFKLSPFFIFHFAFFILLGLLPYGYILLASSKNPPMNWGNTKSVIDLLQHFFRSEYGTFKAATIIRGSFFERWDQLEFFFRLFFLDFTVWGMFFVFLGLCYIWFRYRHIFWTFVLGIFLSGPFFFFYASFPLGSIFALGLSERFSQISYIFFVILLGLGMHFVMEKLSQRFIGSSFKIFWLLLLTLPVLIFFQNYSKLSLLKSSICEDFARNVLSTPEENSILFVYGDTLGFTSSYLHYVKNFRKDLKLVTPEGLTRPWKREQFLARHPELDLPDIGAETDTYKEKVLEEFLPNFPIFTTEEWSNLNGYVFVPLGLTKKVYVKGQEPRVEEVKEMNRVIWEEYDLPTPEEMKMHKPLLLEHMISGYAYAYEQIGHWYFSHEAFDEAIEVYEKSLNMTRNQPYVLNNLGVAYAKKGECFKAISSFREVLELDPRSSFFLNLALAYSDCLKQADKGRQYYDMYRGRLRDPQNPDSILNL